MGRSMEKRIRNQVFMALFILVYYLMGRNEMDIWVVWFALSGVTVEVLEARFGEEYIRRMMSTHHKTLIRVVSAMGVVFYVRPITWGPATAREGVVSVLALFYTLQLFLLIWSRLRRVEDPSGNTGVDGQ